MSIRIIEVRIWNRRVGALAVDPARGMHVFEYAPAWIQTGVELAPRMMPLALAHAPFAFPELSRATYHGLPGMLADALPDAFGNTLIDAWMASKGIQRQDITTLDRLAYMGKRGLGALEFYPPQGRQAETSTALRLGSLVKAARDAVHGVLGTEDSSKAALTQIMRVGTSAGGARAKAVIAWNPETQEIRSGQFSVPDGFEHWLLKFDGVGRDRELGLSADYGRIEYAYHLMALAAGIEMSPCRLLQEHGRAHFMTRRFDRELNRKHHLQSLCAIEHLDFNQRGSHAYAQAFMAAANMGLGQDATDELFRRMAFNVMTSNCDDHTKNLGFILREGGCWALAPAYDITHAYNPKGEWTNQHQMSVNRKFSGITRDDLLREADRFGVKAPGRILVRIEDAMASFGQFAGEAGLVPAVVDAVTADFHRL